MTDDAPAELTAEVEAAGDGDGESQTAAQTAQTAGTETTQAEDDSGAPAAGPADVEGGAAGDAGPGPESDTDAA